MIEIIKAAGWPIIPLIVCSILAIALIIERFFALQDKNILPKKDLNAARKMLQSNEISAKELNQMQQNSALGFLLSTLIRQRVSQPVLTKQQMHAELDLAGTIVANRLEKGLTALGSIASAAPMLGLLGTVIGMIEIFAHNQSSSGNPQQLAHGISIALYNTAFGLIVAIPSLIFWRYFRRKIDDALIALEVVCKQFIDESTR